MGHEESCVSLIIPHIEMLTGGPAPISNSIRVTVIGSASVGLWRSKELYPDTREESLGPNSTANNNAEIISAFSISVKWRTLIPYLYILHLLVDSVRRNQDWIILHKAFYNNKTIALYFRMFIFPTEDLLVSSTSLSFLNNSRTLFKSLISTAFKKNYYY